MRLDISPDPGELARRAGAAAAAELRDAIAGQGRATLLVAAGASQSATLAALVAAPGIAWDRVTVFPLDEYLGLDDRHPASFMGYLRERLVGRVPGLAAFHAIDGATPDPGGLCRELGGRFRRHRVDVACIGIGENGHLAFNDPPADFTTPAVYHVVALDEACRRQQVGEGWFPDLAAVPARAISITIPALLTARILVCSTPDARKAAAVRGCLRDAVDPACPATALRGHGDCRLFLDEASAALLPKDRR